MTTHKLKFPNTQTWEKLLGRWSDFPSCGEKRLICAVIASAITDAASDMSEVALGHKFFGRPLDFYCRLIALNSAFVREQVLLASTKHGESVELSA